MHASADHPPRDPAWRGRVTWTLLALVLLWPLLVAAEFKPWTLADAQSLRATLSFLGTFVPPAMGREFLALVLDGAWVTVSIATAGLALALAGAIPLTLIATRRLSISHLGRERMDALPEAVRRSVRGLLAILRSVPELVFALLFVRVVGLGPTAGVLAIALSYCGMLAKVFAEIIESSDPQAAEALLRNGSGRLHAFLYGTLPQCASELVSYTVYRWECAIRCSVILGLVGAGGLGQQLDTSLKMLAGGEVATVLAAFVLLVGFADGLSGWLRRRLESSRAGWWIPPAALALGVASFATLRLEVGALFSAESVAKMREFASGFVPPEVSPDFLRQVALGARETLAMSLVGSVLAVLLGMVLALPASQVGTPTLRHLSRLLLNVLRSIPELVWAALLVIAAGLGPFPGTLALALHTAGVLGRLFADALENLPPAPAAALRINGATSPQVFLYATLPQALPQFSSYALYRWENNIRAATVLGVVGAGGLGQMLYFHLSLFQMQQSATVILAMLGLVLLVDALSAWARRRMTG